MKRMDTLLTLVLGAAIALCLLTVLDYLALHDIYKDYVSAAVLSQLNIALPIELPAWTNTQLEWNAVTINYLVKTGVTVINLILIVMIRNLVRKNDVKQP
jgi:hypothetical protein